MISIDSHVHDHLLGAIHVEDRDLLLINQKAEDCVHTRDLDQVQNQNTEAGKDLIVLKAITEEDLDHVILILDLVLGRDTQRIQDQDLALKKAVKAIRKLKRKIKTLLKIYHQ